MVVFHPNDIFSVHRGNCSVTTRLPSVVVCGSTPIVLETTATVEEAKLVDEGTTEDTPYVCS